MMKYRAYFTSYINAYPFLEILRERRVWAYQGYFRSAGCYIVRWN